MAARAFWRRIDLRWVNVALCVAVVLCTVVWWDSLRWAVEELPSYLSGSIGSPVERSLYVRASKKIERGEDLEGARAQLERSLAIDPNSNARYWLGEYYVMTEQPGLALAQFERFLEFDPTRVDAYLRAAELYQLEGNEDRARAVLERGLTHFTAYGAGLQPHPDPDEREKFNKKAIRLRAYYADSAVSIRDALERLELSRRSD